MTPILFRILMGDTEIRIRPIALTIHMAREIPIRRQARAIRMALV
jgi:hypothetical protein